MNVQHGKLAHRPWLLTWGAVQSLREMSLLKPEKIDKWGRFRTRRGKAEKTFTGEQIITWLRENPRSACLRNKVNSIVHLLTCMEAQ